MRFITAFFNPKQPRYREKSRISNLDVVPNQVNKS